MKVLMTRPQVADSSDPWYFPSGLGYIAGSLLQANHEVEVVDPCVETEWGIEEHIGELLKHDFDILGISALINKYGYVKELSERLKKVRPGVTIILGGNITGPIWEILLNRTPIDYLVIGEGEETIVELLATMEKGGALENIHGLAFRNNGELVQTPMRKAVSDLDSLPFPPFDLFPMEKYISTPGKLAKLGYATRDLTIITSRGCPYSCTFCYRPEWEKVRHRSLDNVIEEIRLLKSKYGIDGVIFNDELTLWNKKVAYQLCEVLKDEEIIWGCVGRVNIVDAPMLKAMHKAGCRWMTYGLESGSPAILEEMRKKANIKQAISAVKATRAAGIHTNPTFILGYPSETRETAMETVSFIKKAELNPDSFFFATPYPGTELFDDAVRAGKISITIEEYLSKIDGEDAHNLIVNLTSLSDEELLSLREEILKYVAPTVVSKLKKVLWVLRHEPLPVVGRKIYKKLKKVRFMLVRN